MSFKTLDVTSIFLRKRLENTTPEKRSSFNIQILNIRSLFLSVLISNSLIHLSSSLHGTNFRFESSKHFFFVDIKLAS